ncbi:heat-inducible transcription repressor HrcA [Antricoccus suffuscus]|uniref:Heat-inducible transcription repressor HrcA n=1 Tax=Antricoccus suffuscus TaxID=1629062 RepID=A0A2T0Z4V1_9ACTN|nr:heat-inducible transcriptional repressor HrcA [Antricoccus suffuscus]PRZ31391.1 heat-inducible transcription repressor HrcA [Antricoccus suffuscus]
MASEDRKLDVLRAIVEDFVSTREPVGSKAIVERHRLGVSAATVRNDMAQLEDEGYITHPHTSAGRIPTDKGYRLFVDRLSTLKPLSAAERKAIEKFISGAVDLDDILRRSVRLLAQVTRQAAVVSYPSLSRSSIRHIELVPLAANRVMTVVITDTGRVEQRVTDVPTDLDADDIALLRAVLNAALTGVKLAESSPVVAELPEQVDRPLRPTMSILCTVLLDALVEPFESRIVIGGAANLTRNAADFTQSLGSVLEALEEHVVLLRLIDESAHPDGLYVSIGEENEVEGLRSTALVAIGYGEQTNRLGGLGVVGPTRMDYSANMSAVLTVARYIGRLLSTT